MEIFDPNSPEALAATKANEAASTWAQENKKIMAPEGSVDAGRIADLGAAQEMAQAEQPGRDAALATQSEMQRQAETGLNPEERVNQELMDGVKELFPDAFTEVVGNNGRNLLFMEPNKQGDSGSVYQTVMTLDGLFIVDMNPIGGPTKREAVDWVKFIDEVKGKKFLNERSEVVYLDDVVEDSSLKENSRVDYFTVYKRDLTTEHGVKYFNNDANRAQIIGEEKKKANAESIDKSSAKSILSQLSRQEH